MLSGSLDCSVKLWDFQRLAKEIALEDVNVTHNPDIKRGDNQGGYMLRTYATKSTPVLNLHYTRRNVLLAVGVFEANGWAWFCKKHFLCKLCVTALACKYK